MHFRIVVGIPLPHHLVIFHYYSAVFFHVATMANLSSYVLLKAAYLISFNTINNIFDETIIKFMKVVSLSIAALSVAIEITWKVAN